MEQTALQGRHYAARNDRPRDCRAAPMEHTPLQGRPMEHTPLQGRPMEHTPLQGRPMGHTPPQGRKSAASRKRPPGLYAMTTNCSVIARAEPEAIPD